ncbi:DivIVA domain-containing protein [Ruminococcus albus]|uniref:Cell division initiation protein n=1 Tax=Ruminococcus albus TaxID=1264 RepID=A0A1I1DSF0_RUMAL|nr:DivIVA domain-containing protein [Ruminococcus albus]SFB77326.1 cell division initiation protein [Ruminococcus albus]
MMTAKSIKSAAFESEKNGYSPAQVDRFLAEVAKEFAALEAENADSEAKISKLVEKVSEYKEDEDAIKGALLSAQKEAAKIINDAKNKAAAIVDSAKSEQRKLAEQSAAECEKIVREHKERCAALIKENTEITEQKINALRDAYDEEKAAYDELRAEVTYFKSELTSLYQEQIKLVMQLPTLTDEELDAYENGEGEYYDDEEYEDVSEMTEGFGDEPVQEQPVQQPAPVQQAAPTASTAELDKVLNTGSFDPVIHKPNPEDLQFGKKNG